MVITLKNKSIWELTTTINKRASLQHDIDCDILIVGAGLAGSLLGYFLALENKNVVLIDMNTIGSGATKNTTAKITAQQGLIYNKLLKSIGFSKTELFYKANTEALNMYNEIISKKQIPCDFEISDSHIYTLTNNKKLKKEYSAYKKLGIKGYLTKKTKPSLI